MNGMRTIFLVLSDNSGLSVTIDKRIGDTCEVFLKPFDKNPNQQFRLDLKDNTVSSVSYPDLYLSINPKISNGTLVSMSKKKTNWKFKYRKIQLQNENSYIDGSKKVDSPLFLSKTSYLLFYQNTVTKEYPLPTVFLYYISPLSDISKVLKFTESGITLVDKTNKSSEFLHYVTEFLVNVNSGLFLSYQTIKKGFLLESKDKAHSQLLYTENLYLRLHIKDCYISVIDDKVISTDVPITEFLFFPYQLPVPKSVENSTKFCSYYIAWCENPEYVFTIQKIPEDSKEIIKLQRFNKNINQKFYIDMAQKAIHPVKDVNKIVGTYALDQNLYLSLEPIDRTDVNQWIITDDKIYSIDPEIYIYYDHKDKLLTCTKDKKYTKFYYIPTLYDSIFSSQRVNSFLL